MTEVDHQQHLLALKTKERQLRQRGMHDEAAQLLNQYLKDNETMKRLAENAKLELKHMTKKQIQRKSEGISDGNNHWL